jgi:hypothetical protein
MSELIDGTALEVVEADLTQSIDQLSPEEQEAVKLRMLEMQKEVATATLKSEHGWEILRQFYSIGCQKILATSAFVVPVLQNREAILKDLADPTGFQKSFQTLIGDIAKYKDRLGEIWQQHQDKTGQPSDLELPLVFTLSEQYSSLLTELETVVEPLVFALIDTVRDEYKGELVIAGSV